MTGEEEYRKGHRRRLAAAFTALAIAGLLTGWLLIAKQYELILIKGDWENEKGNTEQAEKDYLKACEKEKDRQEAYRKVCTIRLAQRRFDDAEEMIAFAQEYMEEPEYQDLQLWYGEEKNAAMEAYVKEMMASGDRETAEQYARQLVEDCPYEPEYYERLADILVVQENYDEAIEALEAGRTALEEAGEESGLQEYYDELVALRYDDLVGEGKDALLDGPDYEAARAAGEKALELCRERPEAYELLADTYMEQGDYDGALAVLESSEGALSEWEDESGIAGRKTEALTMQEEAERRAVLAERMGQIEARMASGDYASVPGELAQAESEWLEEGVCYFQNGQVLSRSGLADGEIALRVQAYETDSGTFYLVYRGAMSGGEEDGAGVCCRFWADGSYTVAEGTWSGGMGNGTFRITDRRMQDYEIVYEGNVKEDYYDGEITMSWTKLSESRSSSAVIYAENGTFPCIRQEDGKYVYAEDGQGWGWYVTEEADLTERGIYR